MIRIVGRAALGAVAALLLAAGCASGGDAAGTGAVATPTSPGGSSGEASPGDGTPATGGPSGGASPSAGAPGARRSGDDTRTVEVTLVDHRIEMDTSLPAGSYTFVIEQAGRNPHALAIRGPGVEEESQTVQPRGGQVEMAVTLQPGRYEIWCPVGNHRAMGMAVTLEVT